MSKSRNTKRAERETEDLNARNDKMREVGEPANEARLRALLDRVAGEDEPRGDLADEIERGAYLNELAFAAESMLQAGTQFRGETRRQRAARALAFVHAAEAIARARYGVDLRPHGDVLTRTTAPAPKTRNPKTKRTAKKRAA